MVVRTSVSIYKVYHGVLRPLYYASFICIVYFLECGL